MNKKKSKVLAFLLATAMLVPSANGTIYAATDLIESKEVVEDVTATNNKIDENLVKYDLNNTVTYVENESQLREALKKGGEVILSNDIEIGKIGETATNDNAIRITSDTILNLNGNTIINNFLKSRPIRVNTKYFKLIANGGGIKVADENIGSYGFFEIGPRENESVNPETVIIDGGTYSGKTDNGSFFKVLSAAEGAKFEINNINIDTNNYGFDTNMLSEEKIKFNFIGGVYNVGIQGIKVDILSVDEKKPSVIFDNVKIVADKGPCVQLAGGVSVFDNCEFIVTGNYLHDKDSHARSAIGLGYNAIATVNSGTYYAKTSSMEGEEGYGVYIYPTGGVLTINNGSFAGSYAALRVDSYGKEENLAKITVENGDFDGDMYTKYCNEKEQIIINGGNFKGLADKTTPPNKDGKKANNLTVNGGKFDKSVKDFVNDELKYELENKGKDEENNDVSLFTYHKTLQDAADSSSSNSNITPTKKTEPSKPDEPEKKSYTVKLNYNDGTGKVLTLNGYENEKITLPKPERDGEYNFLSWKDNKENEYKASTEITLTNNLEFTAQWEKIYAPSIPSKPSKPTYTHEEIIGLDRYETAAKIADKLGSYDTAVLVNATSTMSDGLSAAGLAGKEDAAILLVKKDSIPKATMDRLKKVKKVYIIGGENAISQKVVNQLKKDNVKVEVERLGGKTRVETSELVAKEIGSYKKAFVVNGFKGEADAMSASSVAAREEAPILLTNGKTSTHAKKSNVKYYVVGGKNVMNNAIADKYNAEIIAGDDRYETNREMVNEFYGASETLYFANGETLVDALTSSTIAKDDGLVLVGRKSDNKILNRKNTIQVGGMNFDVNFEK